MLMKMLVFYILLLATSSYAEDDKHAVAELVADNNSGVTGTVKFTQKGDHVEIEGTIMNLEPGNHGFHVHQTGDLSKGCTSTGGHFNPHNKSHGSPSDEERHVGDLGNIVANDQKVAKFKVQDSVISLKDEENCILNRAIVVHAGSDDLGKGGHDDSLTTGHAGGRLACGIIKIK